MALASYDLSVKDRAFRTPKRERVAPHESTVTREPRDTIVPASSSKWNDNNLLSLLDSRNFSWLSSTSTVSTASSPVDSKDVWDPPETPYSSTDKTSPRDHQTPLTPSTPSVSSRKLRVTPVSKLSFDIETSSVSKRHFLDEDDVMLQSESYRPLKLFRDIDIEFEPISHRYTPSICVNYDMNPSFIFTHGSHNSIASRTRSKTSNKAPVTTEIHTASGREEGRVEAPHNPTNTPVQEGLRKLLEHIIPFDLHARLADTARLEKCVGSMAKAPSDRCNYKRKVQASLTGEDGILKSLASCKTKDDCVGMLSHIKEVIEAVMCRTHQHAAMRRLEEESGDALQDGSSKDVMIVEQVDRYTLGQWIDAICDPRASINRTSWYKNIAKNAKPDVLFKPRAASTQSQIQQPCSSDFMPYQTEKSRGQSVSSAIREKATSPLGSKDHSSGFVYLYWDKLYFGKVKIGYTDNLARRLKEWDKKCKREHIYHSNTESQVEMSHVHRVEQLIHAELKQCRYQRQCEGCGKLHKEWFEATEVHAIKVLKRWREWILQEPYVQDQRSGDWVIRPEMLDTLDRMCAPLPQEVVEQEHHKRNGGLQRVTPKKKKGNRRTI